MCGRFTLITSGEAIAEQFHLPEPPTLAPRYNIAPTQPVAAVRRLRDSGGRELTLLTWGLIPSWAKDPTTGARMINARSETVAEKPAFRAAYKYRRCLIPTSGFYEWQKTGRQKQPYFIHLRNEDPFAFAGLWEHWQAPDGSEIESCTILTTEANEMMRPLHDRMPVILDFQDYDLWLDPLMHNTGRLQPLLRPYPADLMAAYPVSTLVNSPHNDDPRCLTPLAL